MNHLRQKTRAGHWLLVFASLLALVSCGEGKSVTPVSVLPTLMSSPLLPTIVPTPTPDELQPMIVTLELWLPEELDPYGSQPGADVLAGQLDNFSDAYPDVQIEVIVKKAHGRGGLLDFLLTARDAAPSVTPDLIILDAAELETAVELSLVQPLDNLLSPDVAVERFPFAAELGTVKEQTAGFLVGADMQHLTYRPSLLDSPPISWTQDFFPPASFVFPAGGQSRQVDDSTLIQYLAAGGVLVDEEGNPSLDEDVLVEVFGFYSDCVSASTISKTIPTVVSPTLSPALSPTLTVSATAVLTSSFPLSVTTAPTGSLLISPTIPLTVAPAVPTPVPVLPNVSMAVSPTVVLVIIDAEQAWNRFQDGEGDMSVVWAGRYWLEADEAYAPAPIPTRDGNPFSIARQAWAIAMVADDPPRQALSMLLLNWLIAADHNGEWTQAAGYLPGLRTALRQWDMSSTDRAVLRDILDAAVPPPPTEIMSIVGPPMHEELRRVLRGWATPEEAAASAIDSLRQ